MNLLKISRFPDFIQYFPDLSQRFTDFSLAKFFKVRKCERCGSLNPRLLLGSIVAYFSRSLQKRFNPRNPGRDDFLVLINKNS